MVLNDVSLEIEAGRRTFITGNNGAGKSTLIKALTDRVPE
ncbi:ATP-binding cassette domain-containing protein, partial [Eggerthella lenta]|nr:ABC transporter ATP-binding protein [Eggerthella lenta]